MSNKYISFYYISLRINISERMILRLTIFVSRDYLSFLPVNKLFFFHFAHTNFLLIGGEGLTETKWR